MDYQTALKMFQQAEQDYLRTRKKTKADELRWANEVLRKGTMADRIALAVSLLRESPMHGLSQLEYLLEVARSPVKRNCIMVIPTIAKIFIDKLLPKGSTLHTYKQFLAAADSDNKKTPSSNSDSSAESNPAVRAVFEQQVKDKFSTFLTQLETALNDPLNSLRETALRACFALLFRTDEQSGRLLNTVVSKLADQDSRVASFTVTKLVELATHVPVRRAAFVEQLGHFLVTVTSSATQNKPEKQREARLAHAQYLAVCCLNQLIFRKNDEAERQLATRIARLYFSLFRSAVFGGALPADRTDRKSKKAVSVAVQFDSRLISALLTGMQRAFVYADASAASLFDKQLGLLFRIVHSENFSVSLQAFQVLYRLKQAEAVQQADTVELVGAPTRTSVADRFYTALYGTLLRGNMPSSSKLPAFFNLVYKAVRTDSNPRRVRAFIMRLLIAAGRAPSPAFACATLILISQVWKDQPHATAFVPEAHPAATNVTSTDATVADPTKKQTDSDSDEEHFEDVPDDDEQKKVSKPLKPTPLSTKSGTWLHRSLRQVSKPDDSETLNEPTQHTSGKGADSDSAAVSSSSSSLFEGTRNPKFARDVELTYLHLLLRLTEHYHPSVAYFARRLLDTGEPLRFDGDVFEDFALPAFLRRFVLKNPPKSRKQDAKAKRNMQNKRKRIAHEARLEASQPNGDKTGNAADEHLVRLFAEFDQLGALKRPRRRRNNDKEVSDNEFDDYLAKYDRKYLGLGADEDGEDDELQDETLDFADEVRSKMQADELDRLSGAKKRKRKNSGDSDSENDNDSDNEDNDDSDSEFEEEDDFEDGENDEDVDAEENTEDESDEELSAKPKRSRNANAKSASLFADADEYAALIESDMNDNGYDDDDVDVDDDDADGKEQLDEDDGSEGGQASRPTAHQSVKRRKLGKGASFGPRKRVAKGQFMKRPSGSSMRRPTKRF